MSGASVSEIHGHPLRPEGFEEPLFPTRESRRAVAEHLARSSWLCRASELSGSGGEAAHRRRERAHVIFCRDGRAYLVRPSRLQRGLRKERIVGLLQRWREVGHWWDGEACVDRLCFRVELAGGAVVDLVLERPSGEWMVVGVVD